MHLDFEQTAVTTLEYICSLVPKSYYHFLINLSERFKCFFHDEVIKTSEVE